ncbi:MAG: hypothetical protein ABIQ65_09195 [Thermoanaerobaculia bacterium]
MSTTCIGDDFANDEPPQEDDHDQCWGEIQRLREALGEAEGYVGCEFGDCIKHETVVDLMCPECQLRARISALLSP